MFRALISGAAAFAVGLSTPQPPAIKLPPARSHRLEATPATVAYGYYWAEAKPVLRVASGDIIDVDTLLTNSPTGLRNAGVVPERIQNSLKAIVAEVTGEKRGPGGHILTGPVYVEGSEPGDVLEIKILSVDLAIDYGYNGCSGFIPANCDRSVGSRIIALDRKAMTALAIQEMVDFLVSSKGLTRHQAYQLVSIAGNVAITQLVDRPAMGVHVKMPKNIFTRPPARQRST
jgi:acetamidase/formamidase